MKAKFIGLAGALLLSACGQNAAPTETVKELMATKVQPTAKLYWDSVQYISDETGDHDIVPKNDAEWERTRKAAEDLGKLGELLKSDAYAAERGASWVQFSQGLIDISKQAEKAAADKKPEAIFEVGGTIYSVCSACHQAFPASTPEPGASATGGAA
ncbi:MAG: hypothetical protein B7Z08_02355 [Sphingomonadales bacterium 32-68-7]|nr:MAG: hypothetical protein B7Z33_03020 [Sphingomonadales bacterium 12-68-11]OYX10088.1 MAG: hypothetical protein B7Z08_02355 [Sphingomonadales bacterium 32-68-7]